MLEESSHFHSAVTRLFNKNVISLSLWLSVSPHSVEEMWAVCLICIRGPAPQGALCMFSIPKKKKKKTSSHPCTQIPDPAENRSITPTVLLKDDLINSGILSHFCVLRFSFSFSIFVYREVSIYHSRNRMVEAARQTILIGYVMRLENVNDGSLLCAAHVLQHVWVCREIFALCTFNLFVF